MIGSVSYNLVSNSKGEVALPSLVRGTYSVYASFAGDDNYYGDFTFAGNGKYQGCTYEGNVTVIHK